MPIKLTLPRNLALALMVMVLGLMGCSGGETGTGMTQPPPGQDDTVIGPITGFGSVIVNGIRFETTDAVIIVDGAVTDESALDVGMVVTVKGDVNEDGVTGVAKEVRLDNEVKGYVDVNNVKVDNTLKILGQTVVINNDTLFKSEVAGINNINQLTATSYVEVNGYADGSGIVYASYIKVSGEQGDGNVIKLKGEITAVQADGFSIGETAIAYDSTTEFENVTAAELVPGLVVSVESTRGQVDGRLLADDIELLDLVDNDTGGVIKLVGIVTRGWDDEDRDFFINGQRIVVNNDTTVEGGMLYELTAGAKVAVEGEKVENGMLAHTIDFAGISQIQMTGSLEDVDDSNNTVTLFGQTVYINQYTQFRTDEYYYRDGDDEHEYQRSFNFADLDPGNVIGIRAYVNENGELIATRFERDSEYNQDEVSGIVESVVGDNGSVSMTLEGLALTIDATSVGNLSSGSIGEWVDVEGRYEGQQQFTASRIEYDD